MSTNVQPGQDKFDDVEGHAFKAGLAPEPTDEVEGHAYKIGLEAEQSDDVEGHSASGRF